MINDSVTVSASSVALVTSTTRNVYASLLIIQNNSGATCLIGGSGVSATRGIQLATGTPGGSATMQFSSPRGICLNQVFIYGTGTVDFAYETSQ